nr:hypothetical protein [Tanacetum cinerariifolium]
MSEASSAVTYTSVYIDSEPGIVFWGADEELSDGGYVDESDPEEDPEEYEKDETENSLVDYPMDGGDDGDDDDDDNSSGYDADDEDEDNEDEEEEEEHLAPADSTMVIPIDELVSPPEGIKPTIPPPSTDTTTIGARITIRPQTSISLPPEAEVERLLAMPTPPPSPFTSLSPPSAGERLARCTALAALPSPPLPPSSYPPPLVDSRDDIPESEQPPRKRLCLATLSSRMTLQETVWIVEEEAYAACEAWALLAHQTQLQLQSTLIQTQQQLHETHSQMQQTEMAGLRETDRLRQSQIVETLRVMRDMRREMGGMQAELLALRGQPRRAGQPGGDIRVPNHQDAPRDADTLLRNSTNGYGSQSSHEDNPRHVQTTRPCFYADFMKCHPLNFKGNEGVVGLTRWIEKMESVFNINGCTIENQVKFATCTLFDAALTWWNGQIQTLGPKAYAMTWEVLKKKMTDKYCPQGEIKKLEIELWNLKVKGNDVPTYTNHFQELTLICTKFVANENEKIDKYISGLSDNIYGNVKSSKPRTLDETIELTNDLMDQKLRTYAERADNKRKTDDTSRNNHGHQQQPLKKQNVTKVSNMGAGERKPYEGSFSKCTKCKRHHNGRCTQKCHKWGKVGNFSHDCRSSSNANVENAQRDGKETPKGNGCFEYGASGHFKRDCPKLKNKNGENRNAQGWVYAVGNAEKNENAPMNPDSNVVTFTGNIDPTPLGSSYDVELADGKIVMIDTIIRGCTINFQNHPFNIDLMPVELGSFDVIIEMDWLRKCHAVIVCDDKLVQIPYGNETLTFRGNESNNGRESRLAVISCSKAQEYMAKGCQTFLAQISAKKEEDKSKGKQLKDVPIVQDFSKVFPEDLPGLPPARPMEFQIDLIPGAVPVARAPYRLAPSEMKELSNNCRSFPTRVS